MALNSLGLGLLFTAKDATKGVINKIGNQFESMEGKASKAAVSFRASVKTFGLGLAIFTAGAVGVAAGFKAAGAAGQFGQGLAAVGAVSRATAAEMKLLRESAIEAGIATQFSPDQAVEGLTSLATAGQSAEQATKTLIPVLDLAAGSLGQLGVAGAAEAVVGTLKSYQIEADGAAGVTDKLLRITQLSNFQTKDFASGLAKAAAAGSEFNQDLDDVLITMGLLRDRNIDASSSATAFRESVRRLGADQNAQKAITEKGVAIFDKQSGKMRSLIDIVTDFAEATKNLSEKERLARVGRAFGARGLLAFGAITKATFQKTLPDGTKQVLKGAEAIKELRNQMADAGGTAAEFREKLLDTFEGQKTLLAGSLQTFSIVFGEPFAKALKPVVSILITVLNIMIQTVKKIPGPVKTFLAGLFVAASAGVALAGAIIAVKAAIAILALVLPLIAAPLAAAAILAAKVIAVLLVLAAIGFVIKKAWEADFGGVATFVTRIFSRLTLIFKAFRQLVKQGGFSGEVLKEINQADGGLKNFVITAFALFFRLQKFFEGFFGAFSSALTGPVAELGAVFTEIFEEIDLVLQELGFADKKIFGTGEGFKTFGAIIGSIWGAVATVIIFGVKQMVKNIRNIITVFRIWVQWVNFIRDSVKRMVGFVAEKLGAVGRGIGSLVSKAQGAAAFLGLGGEAAGAAPLVAAGPPGGVVPAAAAAGGTRPGVVATGAVAAGAPDLEGAVERVAAAVARRPQIIDVGVNLDGQKVGEGVANANRTETATTFGSLGREE